MDGMIDLKNIPLSMFADGEPPLPAQSNRIGPAKINVPHSVEPKRTLPDIDGDNWLDEIMDDRKKSSAARATVRPDLRIVPKPSKPETASTETTTPDIRQAQEILATFQVKDLKDHKLFVHKEVKLSFLLYSDSIRSSSEESGTACGMVAAAITNGWNPIDVAGSKAFQTQIFLHACRLGVKVNNYAPSADDLALLRKEQIPLPSWVNQDKGVKREHTTNPGI